MEGRRPYRERVRITANGRCVLGSGKRLGRGLDMPLERLMKDLSSSPDPEHLCIGALSASVGATSVARHRTASPVTCGLLLRGHGQLVGPVVPTLVRALGPGVRLYLPPSHFPVTLCGFQEPLP